MSIRLEGTGVAIVTPFNKDLSVDYDSFEKVINHVISGGVNYIVALGTTGETATLSSKEKESVIQFCRNTIDNRVRLIVGVGGYDTNEVVSVLKELDLTGVSGILSVAPYYNKPSQKGLFEHFKAIAHATSLPVIIYNVPGRTGSNIDAHTVIELARTCNNIIAVKEASGNFGQIMQIIKNKPDGFEVLSGDDALTLPMISIGAKGVISVVGNSHPKELSTLVNAALVGDFERAKDYHFRLVDYINALFTEGSPSGIKASLEIIGLASKHVRLPLVPVSEEHYVKLQELISSI